MEAIAPTPERLSSGEFDRPEISRDVKREYHRRVGTVEAMERRGSIRREQVQAYDHFSEDLCKALRTPRLIALYGRVVAPHPDLDPIDLKKKAVGDSRRALDRLEMMEASVLVLLARERETTLENVGRSLFGLSKAQAIVKAQRTVQIALHKLAIHYGYLQARAP